MHLRTRTARDSAHGLAGARTKMRRAMKVAKTRILSVVGAAVVVAAGDGVASDVAAFAVEIFEGKESVNMLDLNTYEYTL